MTLSTAIPLHLLTPEEQRGAMIALAHVKAHAARMDRNAKAKTNHAFSRTDRDLLAQAARMVRTTADIVRRDLSPEIERWNVTPRFERN